MQDAQSQLLAVQSEAAQVQKAKAMMDVETMRIAQRIEILNNIATQATLLAGSSIAFLGGEALETVDDAYTSWHKFLKILYAANGALALIMSLWVIVISSHLVALTRDASLRKNILKASRLLDNGLKEVRGMHMLAMAALLLACLSGALLNMAADMAIIVTIIIVTCSVQLVFKQQFLSLQFFEEVELELDVAATGSARSLFRGWLEPLRYKNIRRVGRMWREEERRLDLVEAESRKQASRTRAEHGYSPLHEASRPLHDHGAGATPAPRSVSHSKHATFGGDVVVAAGPSA